MKTCVYVSAQAARRAGPDQGRGAYGAEAAAAARPGSAEPAHAGRPLVEPRKSFLSEGALSFRVWPLTAA